eukprot:GEMP01042218.1.p2 GENE.GEMP01042218.1~~GEMP01042218.1.p2  ORF type:complete len:100 (+),score=3.56 GEMP01042218.1:369-668(+)
MARFKVQFLLSKVNTRTHTLLNKNSLTGSTRETKNAPAQKISILNQHSMRVSANMLNDTTGKNGAHFLTDNHCRDCQRNTILIKKKAPSPGNKHRIDVY